MGKGSLGHNNRRFHTKNVDPALTPQNVVFVCQELKDAYQEIFGEALERYNQKQKRNDRKIPDYLEHIQKSKNGEKAFHELVVQVGDRNDTGIRTADAAKAKEIFTDYYHGFVSRNPNMKVFNAVLHMDEPNGTPHLHIDFIPIATGQKRGLEVKNSMRQALQQQGFDFIATPPPPKNVRVHFLCNQPTPRFGGGQWLEEERAALGAALERHGIPWEKQGVHRQHLSIPEYKACAEIVSSTIRETPPAEVAMREPTKVMQLAGAKAGEVLVSRANLEAMQQESQTLRAQAKLNQETLQRMDEMKVQSDAYVRQALKAAECRERSVRAQYSAAKVEKFDQLFEHSQKLVESSKSVIQQNKALREQYIRLKQAQDARIAQAVQQATVPLQAENERLRTELNGWKQRVAALQETVRSLCQFIHDAMRAVFTLKYNYKGGHPNPYKSTLTAPASELIDVLERQAHRALQQADHTELEKGLDGMGLTPELASALHMRKDKKRNQMEIGG
ncbi:plasmid recombination protein [Pseudoflavonifractor capillosus]|uniref:plasmid recombination protein n=1 Tax=Pseudoflavonifractor capillosus TaxID=106588 RepID=UPI001FAFF5DA|nr:plasmid recombination protein [Pseudoflavonifractor capillosus]